MQTIIENEKKLSYYYRDRLMVAMSIFCAFLGVALFFEGIVLVPLLLFGASAALLKFGYEKAEFHFDAELRTISGFRTSFAPLEK